MPILSTALQTLSEMAIHESSVEIPQETTPNIVQQLLEMLNDTPSLTREECIYEERMVPIKKSQRLGYYLIEMEDLSRYMMTTGIQSISEAIGNILQVNDLGGQYHRVAIVIDEHSILDEIATLGYEADSSTWDKKPKPGLGMPLVGNSHEDFKDFRKIANTAELLNVITNRYGLPVVKKNYEMVGLLKSSPGSGSMDESFDYVNEQKSFSDDVKLRDTDGKVVLQEKPKSSKEKYVVDEDHEASREEQPGDIDSMQEGRLWNRTRDIPNYTNNDNRSLRESYIQHLRDIASGKYDDMI